MKVCNKCGEEFDGRDGENTCCACEKSKARRRVQAPPVAGAPQS